MLSGYGLTLLRRVPTITRSARIASDPQTASVRVASDPQNRHLKAGQYTLHQVYNLQQLWSDPSSSGTDHNQVGTHSVSCQSNTYIVSLPAIQNEMRSWLGVSVNNI